MKDDWLTKFFKTEKGRKVMHEVLKRLGPKEKKVLSEKFGIK